MFAALHDGRPQLHLRSLDADTAKLLPATEGAAWPFWSHDGRSVGFAANNQLKRFDLDGGLVQRLRPSGIFKAERGDPMGTSCSRAEGRASCFAFRPRAASPSRWAPCGRARTRAACLCFCRTAGTCLFFATGTPEIRGVTLGSLDSSEVTRLTEADRSGGYLAASPSTGWVLFVRQGALVARRLKR